MKQLFLIITGLFIFISAQAQNTQKVAGDLKNYAKQDTTRGWKHFGISSLAFGQTSLQNWVAGGNNTVSGDFVFNASLNYLNDKVFWDNNLSSEYGLVYSSATDWMKAADKLNLTSIAGRKISKTWSISALLNFYTQFTKGYYYPDKEHYISTFMTPGYLDAALGFSFKPNKNYSLFISPVSERAIFVMNDSLSNIGAFGVDPGKKTKFETGAYLLANTNQTLATNLSLISTLDLFTPYTEDFGNININWSLLLSYKINKLLTANLNTTLRYYEKEIRKIQFKEILGLGLTYTF
jgi:hypothetical protein